MDIISQILHNKCLKFREEYLNLSRTVFTGSDERLTHPGEFGRYREKLVHGLLADFSPTYIRLGDGFIVTSSGEVSTQCDFVAHDGNLCIVRNDVNQSFFMSEAVYVVGEVKSVLKRTDLAIALEKLAIQKKLILDSRKEDHRLQYKHQPLSFLVCEKLDFNYNLSELSGLYSASPLYQHNMILSLEDGLFTYYLTPKGGATVTCQYPAFADAEIRALCITNSDPASFINIFVSYIMQHLSSCHRQTADLIEYVKPSLTEKLEFEPKSSD